MKLYRFSPIKNKDELINAVKYIVIQTSKLCKDTIEINLPINSLTIFAHYEEEYKLLIEILNIMGSSYNENNGPRVKLMKPIIVENNKIEYLRIRKPDPYRMQVGCNDFVVNDYDGFKSKYLNKKTNNIRLIVRKEYEMIEFCNPDYDVLAYVVSEDDVKNIEAPAKILIPRKTYHKIIALEDVSFILYEK